MSCTACGSADIYNAKRQLCRKCYGKYYNQGRKDKIITEEKAVLHEREIEFIKNYFKHTNWVYSPATFRLPLGRYSPDFYDGETNTFIEVAGSRQAYHANKEIYKQFREKYPKICFEIRKVTGDIVEETGRMDWMHGISALPTEEEVKQWMQLQSNKEDA